MLLAGLFASFLFLIFVGPAVLRLLIRSRLGGYQRIAEAAQADMPTQATAGKRVAVIGAGVAGLTSALTLARRGFEVTLIEKNSYLGGKLGSWQVTLSDGRPAWVSHGFHAFFPHYYNLNRFLDSMGLRDQFVSIGDYVIVARNGQTLRFANLQNTPVFNLFSLMRAGMFSWRDALKAPGRDLYGVFLEYDQASTFKQFDHLSYEEFSQLAEVPPQLRLAFNTFARAFFADSEKLSFAELVKSFHFYYLSHDGGLVYEYPNVDYEQGLLAPLRKELESKGAKIRLKTSVHSLTREANGSFRVNNEHFDKVVMATDVVGANAILSQAEGLPPALQLRFSQLHPGQRYAVQRLWLDRDIRADLPVFVITEKVRVLDSVTAYHRFEKDTQAALRDRPDVKSVLELHCYCVPDDLPDDAVRAAFWEELCEFFPELKGAKILDESFQLRQDFTAFHVGLDAGRPRSETGVAGLYCAGDWVKLDFPAMLLEAACASGLVAANRILDEEKLRREEIVSVPLRGLMAGMPSPPARKILQQKEKSPASSTQCQKVTEASR